MTSRLRHALFAALVIVATGVASGACNSNPIITPVKTFDRPSDVALSCVIYKPQRSVGSPTQPDNIEVGRFIRLPLSRCAPQPLEVMRAPGHYYDNPSVPAAKYPIEHWDAAYYPTLRALVPQSARGEVALVDVNGAALVDLNRRNPGFNFVPVGRSPESIRASEDGCAAVTTNTDSCDLAVLDLTTLNNMQFLPGSQAGPSSAANQTGRPQFPDNFADKVVRRITLYAGGVPIEARPTEVALMPLRVPADVLPGTSAGDPSPDVSADMTGTQDLNYCSNNTYHAWITLPGCEAVVETTFSISGTSNRADITRAIHIGRNGAELLADPSQLRCPSDCSGGAAPVAGTDPVAPGGILPSTQAAPGTLAIDADTDDQSIRMVIGDYYGESLSLLTFDPITYEPNPPKIVTLESGAIGVAKVRVSPRTPAGKFVYAIARDGTAHVVDLDRDLECETNPEPVTVNAMSASSPYGLPPEDPGTEARRLGCFPLGDPSTPVRSSSALGPGIAIPSGALARDVAFVHLNTPVPINTTTPPFAAQPQLLVGDFAWLLGSDGRASTVQIYDACPGPNEPYLLPDGSYTPACDLGNVLRSRSNDYACYIGSPVPLEIERASHQLRQGANRFVQPLSAGDSSGTPRLGDNLNPVDITVAGTPVKNTTTITYPTLERVTRASSPIQKLNDAAPTNCSANGVSNPFTFVDVADPRVARNEIWSVAWEGVLPGTLRNFGKMCGIGDATCPRGSFIDAGATLCSRGVLPGDKLELLGCLNDNDCLYSQECRTDPNAPIGVSRGLCLDRNVGDEQVQRCSDILRAQRRYRITAPRQQTTLPSGEVTDQLELAEIYEPEFAIQTKVCDPTLANACSDITVQPSDTTAAGVGLAGGRLPTQCLKDSDGAFRCLRACDPKGTPVEGLCGTGYLCAVSNQSTAEKVDYRCLRSPLDVGLFTDCFHQRQLYQIRAGDAYAVVGGTSGLLAELEPDPVTRICHSPATMPESNERIRLRSPRIPLSPPACQRALDPTTGVDALTREPPGSSNVCQYATGNGDRLIHFENPVLAWALRIFFNTDGGYVPKDDTIINITIAGGGFPMSIGLGVSGQPASQAPRTAVTAPDGQTVFVVDEGKGTTATSLRGQLLRLVSSVQICDPAFLVR